MTGWRSATQGDVTQSDSRPMGKAGHTGSDLQ